MKRKYSEEDVRKAVGENVSIAGVLRQLGLRPVGGNYKTVKQFVKELKLDTSHFTGQGWNVGLKFKPLKTISDEAVFVKDSNYRCSWRLRERYKRFTGITYCEQCKLDSWQGRPITLPQLPRPYK